MFVNHLRVHSLHRACVVGTMSWFRGKSKEPEPSRTESSFGADTSAFEGATNFASGPPPSSSGGGAGMADLQVRVVFLQTPVRSSNSMHVCYGLLPLEFALYLAGSFL